jgi:hypothetical protein
MDAIHVHQKLDSDTLYLPQVRPLIGKNVEIIVREQSDAPAPVKGRHPRRDVWEAALANLRGLDIDWDAYSRQRELDQQRADEHLL